MEVIKEETVREQVKAERANRKIIAEWKNMKIGDFKSIDSNHQIIRVVGGWVFESINIMDNNVAICFIPLMKTIVG